MHTVSTIPSSGSAMRGGGKRTMAASGSRPRWPMHTVSTIPSSGSAMAAAAHVATCNTIQQGVQ